MVMVVAKRVPPGDRWSLVDKENEVFESITDALNKIYLRYKTTLFEIDAGEGTISIDDGIPIVEPIKTFDLYGEK